MDFVYGGGFSCCACGGEQWVLFVGSRFCVAVMNGGFGCGLVFLFDLWVWLWFDL